jgi:hypothetical protein
MLKMMGDMTGKVDEIIDRVGKMTQTVNLHSQSIAKIEAQVGKMANTLNMREDGKLPS